MLIELILVVFFVRYLRKNLDMAQSMPRWDGILKIILLISVIMIGLEFSVAPLRPYISWAAHLMMLYLIYVLYSQREFHTARPIMLAFAPYIIIAVATDVAKLTPEDYTSSFRSMLKSASTFSVIWMVAMWIITNRQRKALEKEKQKTREQHEQNQVTSSLKAQLEVQVAERTAELTRQKEELEQALSELKATQAQLIQAEKMASLGELTAGIAHEIQNPLNFVNNFSEVSVELTEELREEIAKLPINADQKANLNELSDDLIQNQQKINTHGKRADAIVKGMLQHSRSSSGLKEPTDLNGLADEYLRLTYHGLRAKDKSFNASMKTDFDPTIGQISVVPQEIGRVLLNLLTNAFYAVAEKKKLSPDNYEPTVWVVTRKMDKKVEIRIRDNGNGIPAAVKEKIFQPFFTTKPSGEGTGLGLSLSYDIITKGHGGSIRAETAEGSFTEFIIILPI